MRLVVHVVPSQLPNRQIRVTTETEAEIATKPRDEHVHPVARPSWFFFNAFGSISLLGFQLPGSLRSKNHCEPFVPTKDCRRCFVTLDLMPESSLCSMLSLEYHVRRYLHSQNPTIVHRDLKSLNVVLDLSLNIKAQRPGVQGKG